MDQAKKLLNLLLLVFVLASFGCASVPDTQFDRAPYGVFLGLNPEDASVLSRYQTVIIDAQYFTKEEIAAVQRQGTKIYSYLNIGSIETFRQGYDSVQNCILSPYDNWPGEYWVDVSLAEWQRFVSFEAKSLAQKGVDGFFLDNADVYYLYPSESIYEGLNAILQDLNQYQLPVVINGGDVFVSRSVLNADAPNQVITGINQECVFTNINFDIDTLTRQDQNSTSYYQAYLEQCKETGLTVYLTEYASADDPVSKEIRAYCNDQSFYYYISPSINLDGE